MHTSQPAAGTPHHLSTPVVRGSPQHQTTGSAPVSQPLARTIYTCSKLVPTSSFEPPPIVPLPHPFPTQYPRSAQNDYKRQRPQGRGILHRGGVSLMRSRYGGTPVWLWGIRSTPPAPVCTQWHRGNQAPPLARGSNATTPPPPQITPTSHRRPGALSFARIYTTVSPESPIADG